MNILIIIVIYNKSISSLAIFSSTIEKTIDLFIYDNSQIPQNVPEIKNFNISYFHDPSNSGVSSAYNLGAKKASELHYKYILLLDQDSAFITTDLSKYEILASKYLDNYIYAPIMTNYKCTKLYSPSLINNYVGKTQSIDKFSYTELYNIKNKTIINSGLLIPLTLFFKINGFNELIKLDFSDTYFIENYKRIIGSEIILVNLYLKHSLSGDEQTNFDTEYHRFKFYCNGANEFNKSLKISLWWPVFRRLIRLILKYKSLKFLHIYLNYYINKRAIS